ncbi:hypothetical protein ACHWQZ_G011693 [Mnemiopsis leidyi]
MICAHLNITKYSPMRVGKHIPLPAKIKNKRCLLNIQNDDNQCLKWCVIAAKHPHPDNHATRLTQYRQYEDEIDDDGIAWPIPLSQIPKFERQNSVRINVVCYDEEDKVSPFYPIMVSKSTNLDHTVVNVLLLGTEKTTHFVLIKSLNALLRSSSTRNQKHHCVRCFHGFTSHENLVKHAENCERFKVQGVKFPDDDKLEFRSYKKMVQTPVYIVADFEAYIKPIPEDGASNLQATTKVKEHKPCGFAYKVVTPYADYKKSVVVYRDDGTCDVAERFILEMHEEYKKLHDLIWAEEPMIPLTSAQLQSFNSARTCYLCHQPFAAEKRVKDHCHYTGGKSSKPNQSRPNTRSTDKKEALIPQDALSSQDFDSNSSPSDSTSG